MTTSVGESQIPGISLNLFRLWTPPSPLDSSSIIVVHGIVVSNIHDGCFETIPYIVVDHNARAVIQKSIDMLPEPVW